MTVGCAGAAALDGADREVEADARVDRHRRPWRSRRPARARWPRSRSGDLVVDGEHEQARAVAGDRRRRGRCRRRRSASRRADPRLVAEPEASARAPVQPLRRQLISSDVDVPRSSRPLLCSAVGRVSLGADLLVKHRPRSSLPAGRRPSRRRRAHRGDPPAVDARQRVSGRRARARSGRRGVRRRGRRRRRSARRAGGCAGRCAPRGSSRRRRRSVSGCVERMAERQDVADAQPHDVVRRHLRPGGTAPTPSTGVSPRWCDEPRAGLLGVDHRLAAVQRRRRQRVEVRLQRWRTGCTAWRCPRSTRCGCRTTTTMTMSVGAAICAYCGFDSWLTILRLGGDDRLERVAQLRQRALDDRRASAAAPARSAARAGCSVVAAAADHQLDRDRTRRRAAAAGSPRPTAATG